MSLANDVVRTPGDAGATEKVGDTDMH
jgi:hypothetical protein